MRIMTSQLLHVSRLQSPLQIMFQLFDRFPTVPISLLLCVHMNIVFLLLHLHFAIGLLEKSDLDVVASELDAVSSKWYTLGQELLPSYDHHHLDSIRTQHSQNPEIGLRQMLHKRMVHHYTTWKGITACLRSLGDSQLADHLETKYCSSELTTTKQYCTPMKWNTRKDCT